jgi:hypothetical protein
MAVDGADDTFVAETDIIAIGRPLALVCVATKILTVNCLVLMTVSTNF